MRKKILLFTFIFTLILNIAAAISSKFADFCAIFVFPLWVNTLGRLTSLFPLSVGEWMIVAGILWLSLLVVGAALRLLLGFFFNKYSILIEFHKKLVRATPTLLVIIFLIMTPGCFINYHCTTILDTENADREYTVAELSELRDYIVEKCNTLADEVPRNTDGDIIYSSENNDTSSVNRYMAEAAKASMSALGDRFPKLQGFYVTPKPLLFSGFVSQQYMQGYFFPFSMEANFNNLMHPMNKPFTMCHELAHTKSYILEDEANFLAYLACTGSDDIIFEYSGYLGVLNYVNNAFYKNVSKEVYLSHTAISGQVLLDNVFLTDESWENVESTSVLPTETVKKTADTFVDTTLKVNGINDGIASYNRVVELILSEYYKQ